jgi:hypothetical protein
MTTLGFVSAQFLSSLSTGALCSARICALKLSVHPLIDSLMARCDMNQLIIRFGSVEVSAVGYVAIGAVVVLAVIMLVARWQSNRTR